MDSKPFQEAVNKVVELYSAHHKLLRIPEPDGELNIRENHTLNFPAQVHAESKDSLLVEFNPRYFGVNPGAWGKKLASAAQEVAHAICLDERKLAKNDHASRKKRKPLSEWLSGWVLGFTNIDCEPFCGFIEAWKNPKDLEHDPPEERKARIRAGHKAGAAHRQGREWVYPTLCC